VHCGRVEQRLEGRFDQLGHFDRFDSKVGALCHIAHKGLYAKIARRDIEPGELTDHLNGGCIYADFFKGQISLPGGSQENGESLCQTALREAQEEVGVDITAVEVIGQLSRLYVPPSNFCIQPFVGYVAQRPDFQIEAVEVAELIEAPLDALLDPATTCVEDWEIRGGVWPIPFYQFGPHKVWGATAMILAEFVAMLEGTQN